MSGEPVVSVIMANWNGAAHIAEAVGSVLNQSERALELIIADDGSTDDSVARALAAANDDHRVLVVRGGGRTGPGATRNRGLGAARGRWVAIVDSDDLIEPGRLARLISRAEADGADIAADNMAVFDHAGERAHLPTLTAPKWVTAADYAESNLLMRGRAQLGYLKPIFRRALLVAGAYDETLSIGEDADLVQRLLLRGARMRIYPECGYRYRKHADSTSHRLTREALAAMLIAHDKLDAGADAAVSRALGRQRQALLDATGFTDLVAALKARDARAAIAAATRRPGALALLRFPVLARLRRLLAGPASLSRKFRHP